MIPRLLKNGFNWISWLFVRGTIPSTLGTIPVNTHVSKRTPWQDFYNNVKWKQVRECGLGWFSSNNKTWWGRCVKYIFVVFTCSEITGRLVGKVSESWSVVNKRKLLSFSDPLSTLRYTLSEGSGCFHSVPKFLLCFMRTFLECLRHSWRI